MVKRQPSGRPDGTQSSCHGKLARYLAPASPLFNIPEVTSGWPKEKSVSGYQRQHAAVFVSCLPWSSLVSHAVSETGVEVFQIPKRDQGGPLPRASAILAVIGRIRLLPLAALTPEAHKNAVNCPMGAQDVMPTTPWHTSESPPADNRALLRRKCVGL